MPSPQHSRKAHKKAAACLKEVKKSAGKNTRLLTIYKDYLKKERATIRKLHRKGQTGRQIAVARSSMMDVLIDDAFEHFLEVTESVEKTGKENPITLMASGGYGRGELNPGSDIDLQFLVPGSSHSLKDCIKELVNQFSLLLFDLGLEVSYPVRSVKEACKFANKDHQTKTTLLDARFIAGDEKLFETFETAFFDQCIRGHEKSYLS
ncbi:MAG: nucleotidyltransferase domain-containing protein, partial [Verrucomicrobiota bacterium]